MSNQDFKDGLIKGFIDRNQEYVGDFLPELIVNNPEKNEKTISFLTKSLESCDEFYLSVAFLTKGGLTCITEALDKAKNKKGKILCSKYQDFTEPNALWTLLKYDNIDLKIETEKNHHSKGYIFKKGDDYTIMVGSSNLTQNALTINKERNLKICSKENGKISEDIIKQFNEDFENASSVNEIFIKEYEEDYKNKEKAKREVNKALKRDQQEKPKIEPNNMQVQALEGLEATRNQGKTKGLIISSTATGKTYLAAFDVKEFQPKRFLYVVHNNTVLTKAEQSFRDVLGNNIVTGFINGERKNYDAKYIFASKQTLTKDEVLNHFKPDDFDYILIDEAHHLATENYLKITDYFKPKFLLGMTATPERMDNFNILRVFDFNIVYENRLSDALRKNYLVPFHYHGISDIFVDNQLIDYDKFNYLTSDERVRHLISKSEFFSFQDQRIKCLVFVNKIEVGKILAEKFREAGKKAVFAGGETSINEREEIIKQLQNDDLTKPYLEYVFTVDIFNEGVDIPQVNQIMMCRPTESPIVFTQQLGRGLRKAPNKDYVEIIDFIANYDKNYLIPIALFGDKSYNKDNIRRKLYSRNDEVPGASTIAFDDISENIIFNKLNSANLSILEYLKESYNQRKNQLGRIPLMSDFIDESADFRDPLDFCLYQSGSYYKFLKRIDHESIKSENLTPKEIEILDHLTLHAFRGIKPVSSYVLISLLKREAKYKDVYDEILRDLNIKITKEDFINCIRILNGEFDQLKETILNIIVSEDAETAKLSDDDKEILNKEPLFKYVLDLINYNTLKFRKDYSNGEQYRDGFILYKKYSKDDISQIFNYPITYKSSMYGYVFPKESNNIPILVTYHKDASDPETILYDDNFVNRSLFSWTSKTKRTLESKDAIRIKNYKELNLRFWLFVKKSDDEGEPYFLGEIIPDVSSMKETIVKNEKAFTILFKIVDPVEEKLYKYLISEIKKVD